MKEILSYFPYLLIIFLFIKTFDSFMRKSRKLPPGPKPLPIIGNLLELGDKPHNSMASLSKIYGPIMSLKLGQVTTIVVSSSTMAKEVLQIHDQLLSNRTIREAVRGHDHSEYGLAWLPVSTTWRTLRKVCNSHLFSKKALDSTNYLRHKKVQEMLLDVEESARTGKAVEIGGAAFRASLNLLSTTFFSVDFSDSSSDMAVEIKDTVMKIMEVVGETNVADYFPFLRKLDPQGIKRRAAGHIKKLLDLFEMIISQREANCSAEEKDVLGVLIGLIGEKGREDQLDKTLIQHLLVDLFIAGTETTSVTLEWSMAELLKSPKIMSKLKEELNVVVGKGNQVNESDIDRLPYLQALVKETLRLHSGPFLLPRKCGTDVEICGRYTIPKGSQVLVNVWAISRDPTVWENPDMFSPERFLGKSIDVKGRDFELIPFGAGRRICPGLPLGTRMLHLMLSSLIHQFDWKLENGVTPETMNMDDKFGITLRMAQPLLAIPVPII